MRNTSVSVKVKGYKAFEGETLMTYECYEKTEAVLTFILNRNQHPTLTLNIDDKVAYIIDAEIAGKILELIGKGANPEVLPYPPGGYVVASKEEVDRCVNELNRDRNGKSTD